MLSKNKKNYILILPSLFTTGNLYCGFAAILHAFNHNFEKAAYAIIIAGIFDVLDGRVARLTNSQSQFGIEYDSIADVVSFGIAPAVLAYVWGLEDLGRVGWAVCFLFAACGALRLARFNSICQELPKSHFFGLPIPAAANSVAGFILLQPEVRLSHPTIIAAALLLVLGLLMVSSIRYPSYKTFDFRSKTSFLILVFLVGAVAIIVTAPEFAAAAIFLPYSFLTPIQGLFCAKNEACKTNEESGL